MFRTRTWLIPILTSSLAVFAGCATDDTTPVETAQFSAPVTAETPFFTGHLGSIELPSAVGATLRGRDAASYADNAATALSDFVAQRLGATGTETLKASQVRFDDMGGVTMRFDQSINGLDVVGAQLVVQADAETGDIQRINGAFVADDNLPIQPSISAQKAIESALVHSGISVDKQLRNPELTYVLDASNRVILAWNTEIAYIDDNGDPQLDRVFANADTGKLAARHPQHHYARTLETQDCTGANTNKPNVVCNTTSTSSNALNTGDLAIDSAHNYAIATYDYFAANHGRDSIDDNGMTLVSRVHYGNNYNNAFWNGSQMTYGDGDGSTFVPLSQDADVVAHELTHGVTERSSGLVYQNESGALNEAWSDVFGALVDRQEGASITDTWLLGEDIYTPGTPGDALRVMNDPAAAGDYDYYPTRYTGTSDNGGVHWNSGIANLAFVLLVEGGTHPRGKTSVNVPALDPDFDASLLKAGKVFYYANVNCLTSGSNFEAARNCTAAGALANNLGQTGVDAVHAAWDAVGVPGGPGNEPPPPPPPAECSGSVDVTTLLSGATVGRNTVTRFTISVPAGACDLNVSTSGSNGDVDLYVNFDSAPNTTPGSADAESTSPTSNEAVNIASPQAGTWHIAIHGYKRSTGVNAQASYQNP